MEVHPTSDQEAFIKHAIESGRLHREEDAVRDALLLLESPGKFSGEGLQSLGEDDDMLTAMARELVTANGVGESAAAVWRQIQSENNTIN